MHPDTKVTHQYVKTPRLYMPRGFEYAAYRESAGGESGYITGWEADNMIARIHPGGKLRAQPYGALVLEKRGRVVWLNPVVHPKTLTKRQYEDLVLIDAIGPAARAVRHDDGTVTIEGGFVRIPPAAAWNIRRRGWITEVPHTRKVWISAAGRIAMAYRWAKTHDMPTKIYPGLYIDAALDAADQAEKP